MTQPNTPLPHLCLRKVRFYRAVILLATLGPAMALLASGANLEARALNLQGHTECQCSISAGGACTSGLCPGSCQTG